eukprot:TRINITY_DN8131_c2_g1_i1.p3 TRINITY_DN8131_c2_g1~~TRINITY_DN8131_c2_g1_i1.p3  ORF type:complete len:110 (-),score=15.17 TRINITY_DN8131_c2_g1_i1:329-658(-)
MLYQTFCTQKLSLGVGLCRSRTLSTTGKRPRRQVKVFAQEEPEQKAEKKFITREEEPEEYWISKGEREGANPLKDPLALIGILAIFFPFIFLLIAIATGVIDLSAGKFR